MSWQGSGKLTGVDEFDGLTEQVRLTHQQRQFGKGNQQVGHSFASDPKVPAMNIEKFHRNRPRMADDILTCPHNRTHRQRRSI